MQVFHPQIIKAVAMFILLTGMTMLCIPGSALALDFKLRELFQNKVEGSDRFIDNFQNQADGIVNKSSGSIAFYTRQGFSALETFTGLSEQNQLYSYSKNNWLKTIGFGLGVLEGTKDFAVGTVSLLAYLESSPARAITLAYNVQERPQEYKEKVISGGKTVATILANPGPLVGGVYQWGKNTYVEARRDPLKYGQLQGEVATFGVSLLLGGSQVKALTMSTKAVNTAKTGTLINTGALTKTGTVAHTGTLANTGTIASTSTLANTGMVVPGGILAKVTAPFKHIEIGTLIPDFSHLNFGLAGTPVLAASTGKSIGGITLKGATPKPYQLSATSAETANKVVSTTAASAEIKTAVKYPLDVEKLPSGILKNPEYSWIRELCAPDIPNTFMDDLYWWGKNQFQTWEKRLLPQEKDAITRYTKNVEPYNEVLRGLFEGQASPKIMRDIGLITDALNKGSIPEPILVFRGTSKKILGELAYLSPEKIVGKEIFEKGFLSTSLYPKQGFINQWNGLSMVIKVPKGTQGAYLGNLGLMNEAEVLFPPGQKMIIREAKWLKDQDWWPDGLQIVVELQK